MLKRARAGVIFASSLAAAIGLASPASAATPSTEDSSVQAAAAGIRNAGPSCTSLSNGTFCVGLIDNGRTVNLVYGKTGGGKVTVKFGYKKGNTSHFSEGFTVSAGQTKTYAFKNQSLGCSNVVGILSVADQGRFETPPLHNTNC